MKTIAFVCIENSCRSLMAEAFSKQIGKGQIKVYSAGLTPAFSINENAVMVMAEKNIKMDNYYPKKLDEIPKVVDMLITMGCDTSIMDIEYIDSRTWNIEDPEGKDIEVYRKTRDLVEVNVIKIIEQLV